MYVRRWELIRPHLTKQDFVLTDWGSDAGWFSIAVSREFLQATVISVEAGIMSDGVGIQMHREKLREFGVANNILVDTLFGPETFRGLKAVPSDYQLVLSVFHHIGDGFGRYLTDPAEWDGTFCDLVSGAKVTFFEIPHEDSPSETPHRIREWYGRNDVETVIRNALGRGRIEATVDVLGETVHGDKGARKMFKITRTDDVGSVPARLLADYIASAGSEIRVRPYRRMRLALSGVLRHLRGRTEVVHDHGKAGPGE